LPLKSFIALAQWLEKKNIRSVLVGGKLEEKSAAALSAAVPSTINLVGKTTLGDVASLARHTRGCVGNDTALTHLIALAQIKNRHHQPPLKPKAKGKRTAKTMARRGGRFDLKKSPPIITIITPPGRTVWGRPLSADGQTHDHAASNVRVVYKNKASNITLTDITKALQKI
ncbi:MAG: hypothetical protein ORN57_01950, partial [Alphaproteobacteria bacterium]|nr:hypothetical protein [Alphaproteobacteria bacterium]